MAQARRAIGKRLRRALKSNAARWLLSGLAALYVRLVYHTTRWRWVGREHLEAAFAAPCFVAAVWHSRLLPIAMLRPRHRRAVALASSNADGDLIGRTVRNLGAAVVSGSSRDPRKPDKHRGGAEASQKLVAELEAGAIVVITPDGPRGPRMRVKPGAAGIAAAAGAPVLPVAYSVRRGVMMRSWDRFLAPWPFNSGVFVFGPPIAPATSQSKEALERKRLEIEEAMQRVTEEADRRAGRQTPLPGAPWTETIA